MNVLIIQENGRHDANRNFRECFSTQRAFRYHGHEADVWGLGHANHEEEPDWGSYDLIINLENYDETGWVPSLAKVQTTKLLWSIDAHVKGINGYLRTAQEGNYDYILQATPEYLDRYSRNSIWFPNCYDDDLIKPLDVEKEHDLGFCGNINNRGGLIKILQSEFNFKLDEFVIGDAMVEAINSYRVHFNANISIDINYRNFETMGCRTCLLTSHNQNYANVGMVNGENCLVYSNAEEMIEQARSLLRNPNEAKRIASNGYETAKDHTYKKRISQLLKWLGV